MVKKRVLKTLRDIDTLDALIPCEGKEYYASNKGLCNKYKERINLINKKSSKDDLMLCKEPAYFKNNRKACYGYKKKLSGMSVRTITNADRAKGVETKKYLTKVYKGIEDSGFSKFIDRKEVSRLWQYVKRNHPEFGKKDLRDYFDGVLLKVLSEYKVENRMVKSIPPKKPKVKGKVKGRVGAGLVGGCGPCMNCGFEN